MVAVTEVMVMVWWLLAVVFGVLVLWRVAEGIAFARNLTTTAREMGVNLRIKTRFIVVLALLATVGPWLPLAVYVAAGRRAFSLKAQAALSEALHEALREVVERFTLTPQDATLTPA